MKIALTLILILPLWINASDLAEKQKALEENLDKQLEVIQKQIGQVCQ